MKLGRAQHEVTRRVRRLIDLAHDGNVHEASQSSEVPHATLRDLYTGKSTNPSLRTLQALAKAYGVYPGWFTDPQQPAEVPIGGYIAEVPGFMYGKRPDVRREVLIPFASYPLPKLFRTLGEELGKLPRLPTRPIAEDALDSEMSSVLGEYLLRPLLQAEQESGRQLLLDAHIWARNEGWDNTERREQYVRRLRQLGMYWATVFDDLLAGIRERA